MPEDAATLAPQPESIDLATLLWLIGAGDQAALRRLHDHYGPALYAIALRVTGSGPLAADALREAMVQLWRRSVQFRPEYGAPEGWLVAQVRQRAIELVRRRQRSGVVSETPFRRADLATGLARLDSNPATRPMADALAGLDEPGAEIVVHAFLDGMSSAEIAARLNLPIGTIKSATRGSLAALRAALALAPVGGPPTDGASP